MTALHIPFTTTGLVPLASPHVRSIGLCLPQAALRWLPGKVWLWHSRRNAAFVIELIRHEPALRAGLRTGRLLLDLFDPAK